jgi:hypothetical protein
MAKTLESLFTVAIVIAGAVLYAREGYRAVRRVFS